MAQTIKRRIFMDNAHGYLLRIEEEHFQAVVKIADARQVSVNVILNEAIKEYIEKKQA